MLLQLWEWFLIFFVGYGSAIMLYRKSKRSGKPFTAILAFFVFALVTQWAFSPLTAFQDRNNAGNHWWTDPWRSAASFPPLFTGWMWILLILAVLFALLKKAKAVRLLVLILIVRAALGVDYMAGDSRSQAQPANRAVSARDECKSLKDALADFRQEIDRRLRQGGEILPDEIKVIDSRRSKLDELDCGRFKDITTPLVAGTMTLDRADSDTIMVNTEGFKGDGLLYTLQCGDSDQADAKVATYNPDQLRCDYLGEKILPITLGIKDDYGQTATKTEKMVNQPAAQPARCDQGFTVRLPDRGSQGRLNADGARTRGSGSEEDFRIQILDQARVDPLTLFAYYQTSPLGDSDPLQDPNALVSGGDIKSGACYSDDGIAAYNRWATLWEGADLSHADMIAYQGFNTGVSGDDVTHSPGVSGSDREGVDVAYRDNDGNVATRHSALYRCTQPTTSETPSRTKLGKTDNQPDKRVLPVDPTSSPTPSSTPTPSPTGKDHGDRPEVDDPDSDVDAPRTATTRSTTAPRTSEAPQPQPTLSEDPPEVSDPVTPQPSATEYATGDPCANGC